jgi:PAS domain S-box-containing protein
MVWGAIRGGSPGVAAALAGAAATVAAAASLGLGNLDTLAALGRAQGFLVVAGGTCHLLAATVAERTAARHRAEAVEARLRRAIDGAGMATFDTDHLTGHGLWSRSRFEMLGYPPPEGLEGEATTGMWRDRLHPEDREETLARLAEARRTAQPYRTVHRILRADDGSVRWMEAHGRFLDPEDGRMTREGRRNVGVVFDITARVEAEERERLLLLEVEHRAKNALQVARSLLHVTPFSDRDSFVAAMDDRLAAMARAHTLLSGVRWTGADLREIAMVEMGHLVSHEAGEAPRISLEGPPGVRLRPDATQSLALVLHELATNAAKHGALSARGGVVRLYWQAMPDGGARLRWSEQGGPPAGAPPERVGFGSRLIAATVRDGLGGAVEFRWRREGLLVEIAIAAEHVDGARAGQVPQKVR